MYYYAMIDDSNIVTNTLSAGSPISAPTMIPITEEQFNSGNLVGKYYDSSTGEFVDPTPSVLAAHSTAEINHGEEWLSDIIDMLKKKPKKHKTLTIVQNHGITERINSGIYRNGMLILGADKGKIFTSTDFETFTMHSTPLTNSEYVVKFVYDGTYFYGYTWDKVIRSTDGINWSIFTIPGDTEGSTVNITDIVATDGKCGVVSSDGDLYISLNGGAFTKMELDISSKSILSSIVIFNDEFLAVGCNSDEQKRLAVRTINNCTSYDWVEGENVDFPTEIISGENVIYGIFYNAVYTSLDGYYWRLEREFNCAHTHIRCVEGDSCFITSAGGRIFYSDNSNDWHIIYRSPEDYMDFAGIFGDKFITINSALELTIDEAY